MANNIIEIITKVEGQGLDDLNRQLTEAEAKQKSLRDSMAQVVAQQKQFEGAPKVIQALQKEYDKMDNELKENSKSIESLNKAMGKMPGAIVVENVDKSFRELYKTTLNNIKSMELLGQTGTEEYKKLVNQAAELSQIQQRVNTDIRNAGSETATIDAVTSSVGALTGGYTALTGVMSLFGSKNEEAAETMRKLQTAMAISMGITQVSNSLLKQSAMMQGIATIQTKARQKAEALANAEKSKGVAVTAAETTTTTASTAAITAETAVKETSTVATGKATVAQRLFNAVANANPYVLLAMALLTVVGALYAFSQGSDEAAEKTKKYKSSVDDLSFSTKEARDEHDKFVRSIRDIGIEIDVASGKITAYQAALANAVNAMEDSIKDSKTKTKEALDDLDKEYDSFWHKVGVGFKSVLPGNGYAALKDLAEQKAKEAKITEEGNKEVEDITIKGNKRIDKENATHNAKILADNEDMYNDNLKGLQGSLAKIETARRRALDKAQQENEEIKKQNATGKADEQLALNSLEAINQKYDNQRAEAQEQAATKSKQISDKRNAEILKAEQDLAEAKAAVMAAGEDRELAQLKISSDKKINEIKNRFKNEADFQKNASQAEKDLVIFYAEQAGEEQTKIKTKYANISTKQTLEADVATLNAQLALVQQGSEEEANLKIQLAEKQAEINRNNVLQDTTLTEKLRAAKIKEIDAKLMAEISDINNKWYEQERDNVIAAAQKTAKQRQDTEELALKEQYANGLISKNQYETQMRNISIKSLEDEIAERKARGEDTLELEKELADKRIDIAEQEAEARKQIYQELFNLVGDIGNAYFDSQKQQLDQQAADLEHYYTTDAEAAKKNKNLKLISEEEMSRRQLEIKRKQAQAEKNQAIFTATLQYAQGMISALSSGAQGGLAAPAFMAAFAAILTAGYAIQLAAIMSKPLPKYAKGRKGGKGEYGLVGERGAEVMWIPEGASIMPNADTIAALRGDRSKFAKWDIPAIDGMWQKNLPTLNHKLIAQIKAEKNDRIDYDRLGKAVAENIKFPDIKIPKSKPVTVNVDRNGISVQEGNTITKIRNNKFKGDYQ